MDATPAPTAEELDEWIRELLENADLPMPDEVCENAETGEVMLLWHKPRVAVVIDPRTSD